MKRGTGETSHLRNVILSPQVGTGGLLL